MYLGTILPQPVPLPYRTGTGNQLTGPTCYGRLTPSHWQSILVRHLHHYYYCAALQLLLALLPGLRLSASTARTYLSPYSSMTLH